MTSENEFVERRRHERFKAQHRLKNVRLIKEVDADGEFKNYTVDFEKGGFNVKRRFDDIESAVAFINELALSTESGPNRRHNRIYSINIISYECMGKSGNVISRGIGRTLNVSIGGMLLETYTPLEKGRNIVLSIDMEEKLVSNIKAKVVYCRDCKNGRYESGIEFFEPNDVIMRQVNKHIELLKEDIQKEIK